MGALLNSSQLSLGCLVILIKLIMLDYLWENLTSFPHGTYGICNKFQERFGTSVMYQKDLQKVNQVADQTLELGKLHLFLDFKLYNFNLT